IECTSRPVAALNAAIVAYWVAMNLMGFWLVEFQKMLRSDANPTEDESFTHRLNSFVVSPLSIAMQSKTDPFMAWPSTENPSLKLWYATSPTCDTPVAYS